MYLLDQIIDDAVEASSDLGALLRRCKVLASRLGSAPLEEWLLWESNGYPSIDKLPDYRIWGVELRGDFICGFMVIRGHPIATVLLPENLLETLTHFYCQDSIDVIRAEIRKNKTGSIQGSCPNLINIIGSNDIPGSHCLRGWATFGIGRYENILNSVRNRILDFALALQKEEPKAGESGTANQIPNDKLTPIINQYIYGDNHMGDTFKAGQAGAMGPKAHAHDMNFNQIKIENSENLDLSRLQEELAQLQSAMKERASDPEHQIAIGNIAAAEQAAEMGDGPKALQYLKNAGKWALDVAKDIGVGFAVAALTASNS